MEGSKVARYGMWATIAYVCSMLIYVVCEWVSLLNMKPSEFGDFLAGTVGPLAFFWLVAGFYLQRHGLEQNTEVLKLQAEELRNSSEALKFQVQELRNSVEQQARMASIAEQSMRLQAEQISYSASEAERVNSPAFSGAVRVGGAGRHYGLLNLRNTGAAVTILETNFGHHGFHTQGETGPIWKSASSRMWWVDNNTPETGFVVRIGYLRADGLTETLEAAFRPEKGTEYSTDFSVVRYTPGARSPEARSGP